MRDSLKYAWEGYVLFDVNGRKFLSYEAANQAYLVEVAAMRNAFLSARHWQRGWEGIRLSALHSTPLSEHISAMEMA